MTLTKWKLYYEEIGVMNKICLIDTCSNRSLAVKKQWCSTHYKRWKLYGDPNILIRPNHGMSKSGAYKSWSAMRTRVLNKNSKDWDKYGGRGIKICEEWNNFKTFKKDMGERPKDYTLDRIDNDGDYTPQNCRWADRKQQVLNTSVNRYLTFNDATKTMSEWSKEFNINYSTLYRRIERGWSIEKSLGKE